MPVHTHTCHSSLHLYVNSARLRAAATLPAFKTPRPPPPRKMPAFCRLRRRRRRGARCLLYGDACSVPACSGTDAPVRAVVKTPTREGTPTYELWRDGARGRLCFCHYASTAGALLRTYVLTPAYPHYHSLLPFTYLLPFPVRVYWHGST